jgi:hypothetical protein
VPRVPGSDATFVGEASKNMGFLVFTPILVLALLKLKGMQDRVPSGKQQKINRTTQNTIN